MNQIRSATSPCPKCGSYMFMMRRMGDFYAKKCKNCGYVKYEKSFWERLKWKFLKGQKATLVK